VIEEWKNPPLPKEENPPLNSLPDVASHPDHRQAGPFNKGGHRGILLLTL